MKHVLIATLSLLAIPVMATRYIEPKEQKIPSEDGKVFLNMLPQDDTLQVVSKDGDKVLWSFEHSPWHHEYFVSNDGKRVVIVKWKHLVAEDLKRTAIQIIKEGKVETEYSYEQLCTPRKRSDDEAGPIGGSPLIWKEKASTVKDQKLTVYAAGDKTIVIDLNTGEKETPDPMLHQ